MKQAIRAVISMILTLIILITTVSVSPEQTTEAATKYITIEAFAQALATELSFTPVTGATSSGYVNALMEKGVIRGGDVADYKSYLTRGDALVFLNRADEYLYGSNLSEELVQLVIDKRISDINKVKAEKRADIAKAYFKGYMKGYSNGEWSTNRSMKATSKITKSGALNTLKMLHDLSLRAKISPDGQLIRTTNLPYSYKKFPYILASYPNEYYDWKLYYELSDGYTRNGVHYDYVNLVDYATPADVDRITPPEDMTQYNIAEIKEKYLDTWVDKVQTYMDLVFSADYRTIDDDWVEAVLKTDYSYGQHNESQARDKLAQYVTGMKANKTIVEYAKINVDKSSLYYYQDAFYLRTYVKYRIVSSNVGKVDADVLVNERPYKNILWTRFINVNFTNFELGEWRECGFDICIAGYTPYARDMGIADAFLDEYFCKQYPVTK